MVKKLWKKQRVDKWRVLWTKGNNPRKDDFIILDETTPTTRRFFPGDNWKVSARRRINPKTIHGKVINYKNKSSALNFVRRYLTKY